MAVRRYEELITGHAGEFSFYRNPAAFPKTFPLLNVKYLLSAKALPPNPLFIELVYSKEIFNLPLQGVPGSRFSGVRLSSGTKSGRPSRPCLLRGI